MPAAAPAKKTDSGRTDPPRFAAAKGEAPPPRDEKSEARAVAQRGRQRAAREASIRAGLDELQLWIADQLSRGLAAFTPAAYQQCRLAAQRLADAKAPGLSNRLDSLLAELLAQPKPQRIDAALEALGGTYLLIDAYRRQDALPVPLRADVRRLVGWSQPCEALLEDDKALRVGAGWHVVATRGEVQPDKLRRDAHASGKHRDTLQRVATPHRRPRSQARSPRGSTGRVRLVVRGTTAPPAPNEQAWDRGETGHCHRDLVSVLEFDNAGTVHFRVGWTSIVGRGFQEGQSITAADGMTSPLRRI